MEERRFSSAATLSPPRAFCGTQATRGAGAGAGGISLVKRGDFKTQRDAYLDKSLTRGVQTGTAGMNNGVRK